MKKEDFKLRVELIKSKLEKAVDLILVVKENFPSDIEEFKNSRLIRDAVYKEVKGIIELFIDILAIINADMHLGTPEVEDDIIFKLENKKLFSQNFFSKIKEIKKFRNILVHKYVEIDNEKAYSDIKNGLEDFDLIIEEIEKFLSKQ
ncbi:DUF86 domain-containing protein [Candidatus Pacearchaeota archaeon]|nr:DUF86 domain-containing protein [Candidatus Pacearchaeota archaeon]